MGDGLMPKDARRTAQKAAEAAVAATTKPGWLQEQDFYRARVTVCEGQHVDIVVVDLETVFEAVRGLLHTGEELRGSLAAVAGAGGDWQKGLAGLLTGFEQRRQELLEALDSLLTRCVSEMEIHVPVPGGEDYVPPRRVSHTQDPKQRQGIWAQMPVRLLVRLIIATVWLAKNSR